MKRSRDRASPSPEGLAAADAAGSASTSAGHTSPPRLWPILAQRRVRQQQLLWPLRPAARAQAQPLSRCPFTRVFSNCFLEYEVSLLSAHVLKNDFMVPCSLDTCVVHLPCAPPRGPQNENQTPRYLAASSGGTEVMCCSARVPSEPRATKLIDVRPRRPEPIEPATGDRTR